MSKRQKNILVWVLGILTAVVCTYSAYRTCLLKTVFDTDESLSYALANETVDGWVSYQYPAWFGKDAWAGWRASIPFNYKQVIQNQVWDVHPPLFYLILHTVCSFHPDTVSVWYGFSINIAACALISLFMYLFLFYGTHNPILSCIAVVVIFGFSTQMLTTVQLIRMYELCSLFALAFGFAAYRIITKKSVKWYDYLFLGSMTVCGGLTHYFFYYIMACISLAALIYLIIRKDWLKLLSSAGTVVICSLLNLFVFFPGTKEHLFSDTGNGQHGRYVRGALEHFAFNQERFHQYLNMFWGHKILFYIGVILAISGIVFSIAKKRKKLVAASLFLLSWYLVFMLISQTATYVEQRYLAPAEPFCMVMLILVVYELLNTFHLKKYAIYPCLASVILLTDLSMPFGKEVPKKSWEYAQENKDKALLIITKDMVDYNINTSFADIWQYSFTGIVHCGDHLENWNCIYDDFILYADKELDATQVFDYVDKNFQNLSIPDQVEFAFKPVKGVETTHFHIYEVDYKDTGVPRESASEPERTDTEPAVESSDNG